VSDGWTVGQVARASSVTVRALHHWERIGLLVPGGRTANGYRVYSADDLGRLQRLLAYRELGFGLDAVHELLDGDADVESALRRQAGMLRDKAARLLRAAAALETNLEARRMGIELEPHELLEVFGDEDPTRHAAEAEQRWGDTDAWRQSQERTRRMSKQDWLRVRAEADDLEERMAAACRAGEPPAGRRAAELVEQHRLGIEAYYDCTPEMHRALGRMYVEDERFAAHYERRAPGLADWLHRAIEAAAARG
jgi:MerR family transcriptional regulator, thiopeptide resistance regulator